MAYLGGLFTMLSFIPQINLSIKTKKTNDISWGLLFFTLLSGVFYELYAVSLLLKPVILMNGIFIIMVIVLISLKYIYEKTPNK